MKVKKQLQEDPESLQELGRKCGKQDKTTFSNEN